VRNNVALKKAVAGAFPGIAAAAASYLPPVPLSDQQVLRRMRLSQGHVAELFMLIAEKSKDESSRSSAAATAAAATARKGGKAGGGGAGGGSSGAAGRSTSASKLRLISLGPYTVPESEGILRLCKFLTTGGVLMPPDNRLSPSLPTGAGGNTPEVRALCAHFGVGAPTYRGGPDPPHDDKLHVVLKLGWLLFAYGVKLPPKTAIRAQGEWRKACWRLCATPTTEIEAIYNQLPEEHRRAALDNFKYVLAAGVVVAAVLQFKLELLVWPALLA